MKKQRMFNCLFQQAGETYKLYVYDNVRRDGAFEQSETSATYFAEKLSEIPEGATLEIHINSDGGDAFEGTAIYNQLKAAPIKKIGIVDGHAFSAATFVLQACDERVMEVGTTLLVHNAWTIAAGNADELRAVADDLDKLMESNRRIFLERCSLNEEELIALMKENRMLSPEEALKFGFIDRIAGSEEEPEAEPEPEAAEEPAAEEETPVQAVRKDRLEAAERFFKKFY